MTSFILFITGIIIGMGVMYFIAKNNQRKFNSALGIDPKAKWKDVLKKIKDKLS